MSYNEKSRWQGSECVTFLKDVVLGCNNANLF